MLFAQLLAPAPAAVVRAFLSVFVDHAAHPFYQALGQLAQATLAQWQENLPIAVAQNRSIVNFHAAPVSGAVLFLPLSSLSPALIAFASKVIPYHNKPMFSEPRRD